MKAPIPRAVLLAAFVCVPGCNVKVRWGGPPDMLPRVGLTDGRSSTDQSARAIEAYGLKPVNGKEEPHTLIARDGTTCTVSKEKFESTRIGTSVWCTWIDRRR
jgi:hypothetical protein